MRKKWSVMLFGTGVVLVAAFSCKCGTLAAAVNSNVDTTKSDEFVDTETDAEVIDAVDVHEVYSQNPRKGKQFFSYMHLFSDPYFVPGIDENSMSALPATTIDSSCVTNQGRRGTCQEFERCYPLLNLPHDKYGNDSDYTNLQEELYQLSSDRKCSSVVHAGSSKFSNVCCDPPSTSSRDDAVSMTVAQFYNSSPPEEENLDKNSSFVPKYTKIVNTWATCGEKQFDIKIIGGQESIPHEYPWMVSLWGKSLKHICGATIISPDFVLTAAHCIARYTANDVGKIRLHLGDHNIHSTSDGHHEVRSVTRIIKHKRFSHQTFVNDIALLRMDRPVAFSDRIRPICLPSGTRRIDDDENLVVAGWGQTSYKGSSSSVLRKVVVPGVSNAKCGNVYNSISPVGITTDMICAGGAGVDSCIGDSGGALMQLVGNKYEQIGIVSFGRECGQYPGVYSKVYSYLNWIKVNMNKY